MKNWVLFDGMGGLFSGRTEYASTPDDRECMKLDVDEFTDALDYDVGVHGTYSWSNGAELRWETLDDVQDEALQLTYEVSCPVERKKAIVLNQ